MVSEQQLNFAIRAINEASKTLKDVQGDIESTGQKAEMASKHTGGFGSSLGGVAKIASGFVVGAGLLSLPGLLAGAAQAAAEDEQATTRMNTALNNLANTLPDGAEKMAEWSDKTLDAIAAGQAKAFTDDDVRDSLQKLIASTGDFDEAQRRSTLAMDLARGAGIPLEQASTLLGKVTDENVNVFKRMGITMKDNATEADVLATIQGKFGGQADAYAKSTAGQMEQAKIRMSELHEQIGGFVLPIMAKLGTVALTEVLPRIEQLANQAGPLIGRISTFVQETVMPQLRRFGEFFQTEIMPRIEEFAELARQKFAEFQVYYEQQLQPALDRIRDGIAMVIGFIVQHWPEIWAVIKPGIDNIRIIFQTVFSVITGLIDAVILLINGDFSGAWHALGGVVESIWKGITGIVRNEANAIIGIFNAIIRAWNGLEFTIGGGDYLGRHWDGITIGTPNLPPIQPLAMGGIVTRPTLAMIGEAGPEAVIPLSGQGVGSFGGNTYQIFVLNHDSVLQVMVDLERSGRLPAGTTG